MWGDADGVPTSDADVNLFVGKPIERTEPLYWRNHLAPAEYRVALRIGDWKVVASDDLTTMELYNIALDPKETPTTRQAAVTFTVATYGINVPGTVYRMDDVPIPLRPAFDSPRRSDFDVLSKLERRVKEIKAATF